MNGPCNARRRAVICRIVNVEDYQAPDQLGGPAFFLDNMDKREQIAELLELHDLTLHYEEIFSRWIFDVKDKRGKTIWHQKAIDLVRLRNELMDFLLTL